MITIRRATEVDVAVVLELISGLADYEKMSDEVVTDAEQLRQSLFGNAPAAEVLLAFAGNKAVGFAVYFQNYSTFLGRAGIYLEDLFVLPGWRGRGIGRELLVTVARTAVERGCGRMEWAVLDWNQPAIDFYESLGARPMDEWTTYRLTGAALARFGSVSD